MRRLSLLVKTSFCLFILTSSFLPHLWVWGQKREIDGTNDGVPTYFPLDKGKEVERLDGDGVDVVEANKYFSIENKNSTMENSSWNNPHEKPGYLGLGDFPYGPNEPLVESPNDLPSDCESIGESVSGPEDSFQGCGSVDKTASFGSGGFSVYGSSELPTSRNMEDVLVLAMSKTVYVNGSNVGDPLENGSLEHPFDKIQEGINNANSGDMVYVFAGTYKEHLTVRKSLSLVGEDRESVIVDGEGVGDCIYTRADVIVSEFTLRNGGCGVYVEGSSLSVDGSVIQGCSGYGISSSSNWEKYGKDLSLTRSVIQDNGGGVSWYSGSSAASYNVVADNNTIRNNRGGPLSFSGFVCKTVDIRNNLIENNTGGIWCYSASTSIENNTIINSGGQFYTFCSGSYGSVSLVDNFIDKINSTALIFSKIKVSANNLTVENVYGSGVTAESSVLQIDASLIRQCTERGIYSESSGLQIDDSTIESCQGFGISSASSWEYRGRSLSLTRSVIQDNGGGVEWYSGSTTESYTIVADNNTIKNNRGNGLKLDGSVSMGDTAMVSNNRIIKNAGYGTYLNYISTATLLNNAMIDNKYNFGVWGSALKHFTHNVDTSNTVNAKPIYYLVNIRDMIIDSPDAGFIGIVNSVNITIQNLALTNNVEGILFAYVNSSGIKNVSLQNNWAGITLHCSILNYVIGNTISCNERGIYTSASYLNFIYQNNFINNNQSVYVDSDVYVNSWDNGYPNGGNYWSDRNCVGDPSDGSQPYFIYGNVSWNVDRYPFQHPINLETSKSNLRIRVTDSSGNPIAGALVIASYYQLVSSLDLQGITDAGGYVYFNDILSGTYTLYISADNYYPFIKASTIAAGQNNSENLTLLVNPQTYQCWALIVGVAYYKSINDAPFCDFDALALYNRLYPIWEKDHIKLLLNENATRQNINDAIINWLAPIENQNDQVLVFFSGHGGIYNSTYPPYEYICPYDSSPSSTKNDITDDLLNNWLNGLDSQKITIVLGSCNSGGFIPELSKNGRIILTACSADESATGTSDLQHSLFGYYLLESFIADNVDANMDGKISWQEIFSYAEPETVKLNPEQHPQEFFGCPEEPVITCPLSLEFELHLSAGWNMVSFAYLPMDDLSFSNILSNVGYYQVLTWDGTSYIMPSTAEAGRGYWILVLKDTTVLITGGTPVERYELNLPAGWSMIGSVYNSTVNASDIFSGFYQLLTWNGIGYVASTTIEPGQGYWSFVLVPTHIIVNQSLIGLTHVLSGLDEVLKTSPAIETFAYIFMPTALCDIMQKRLKGASN